MSEDNRPILSERAIEMMNLVIDGEATPQERAELQDLLASSAEARRLYESMLELTQTLDAIPPAAAPGVKDEVLTRLGARVQPAALVPFPAARSRRRLVLGLAWAAAAVLVIGLAVDRLFVSGARVDRPSPAQAAASMPPRDVAAWPLLARVESEAAALTIRKSGDRFALLLQSHRPGTLSVRWDDSKLTRLSETPERTLILQRRQGAAGSAVVTVLLEDKPALQTSIELN